MLADPSQDVGQPGLQIDIVHFRGHDQAVHRLGSSPRLAARPTKGTPRRCVPYFERLAVFRTKGRAVLLSASGAVADVSNFRCGLPSTFTVYGRYIEPARMLSHTYHP